MKQRIISGTACAVVITAILCLYQTLVLEASMAVFSALAVYEMLSANGFKQHKPLLYTGVVSAFLMPYASFFGLQFVVIAAVLVFAVIICLKDHSKIGFEKIAFYIVVVLFISLSFTSIVMLRNRFDKTALLYLIIVIGSAWFSDTGAYFTGVFFGKHKLCPVISPKKTVEGLIGGIVSNALLISLSAYIFVLINIRIGLTVNVNYFTLILTAALSSLAGVAGDLTASVIKRQIGIKDYGNLIPGHGGIMDRFDSILFTAPTVYFLTQFITIAI